MYSYGPPHMAKQKQDNQLKLKKKKDINFLLAFS